MINVGQDSSHDQCGIHPGSLQLNKLNLSNSKFFVDVYSHFTVIRYPFSLFIIVLCRLLSKSCVVLSELGKYYKYESVVGLNGRVWVSSASLVITIVIINTLHNMKTVVQNVAITHQSTAITVQHILFQCLFLRVRCQLTWQQWTVTGFARSTSADHLK